MQTIKHAALFSTLSLIFLSGCFYSSTYLNKEEDRDAASTVIGRFYYYTGTKDYDHVYDLFGKEFYKVTSKDKLKAMFVLTQEKLGDRKDTNIGEWETKRVEGTDPSADYELEYDNVYTNADAREIFHLIRESDGQIKIAGYKILSEKFN
jgi:hypothetical protein